MELNLEDMIPESNERTSIIKVIGVGGGGNNAVNHMYRQGINDVDFVICNTDAQALQSSPVPLKIQLGKELTEGLGAGSNPKIGKQSALDSLNEVENLLRSNTKMVFVTAGMGGGTGTGAAPVIAQTARDLGILTVGIVTLPFKFEARLRYNQAIEGIRELKDKVDSLLVINNERLREMFGNLPISQAFSNADNILTVAAKGIAEIITGRGYVNVDFSDVNTIMKDSGVAIMGSATASGQDRAIKAIHEALNSPLLNNSDITGAKGVLLNVEYGKQELTMDELSDITDYVYNAIADDAHFIWGLASNEALEDAINVTIIATRFEANSLPDFLVDEKEKVFLPLDPVESGRAPANRMDFREQSESSGELLPGGLKIVDVVPEKEGIPSGSFQYNVKTTVTTDVYPGRNQGVDGRKQKPSFYGMEKSIDDLENEPAYKRIQIRPGKDNTEDSTDLSRYSLGKHGLSDHNPCMNPKKD